MSSMEVSNLMKKTLSEMLEKEKRFDKRKPFDLRDIEVSFEVSNKAEGSARVKMGKTEVIAGIKLQTGTPYPDSPNKGNLMVSGDLLPIASPRFESGPPGFQAIELPRLVDRAIRESDLIEFSKLVIKEGELVWTVIVDVYPINDDGNLIDAASIAALAALLNAKVPKTDEDGKIDYKADPVGDLPLNKEILPISFSFFKIGEHLVLDPTREEEEASDSRITFGISKWKDGQYMLNSCQKSGEATFSSLEVEKMMDIISKKHEEVITKLKKFL